MTHKGYRSLEVWRRSVTLAANILQLTSKFSKEHTFGIVQQMQRAALSIPSNIAEGYNRGSRKEYVYFLRVALGSAGELETQCTIAVMAKLISKKAATPLVSELDEIGKMLRVMIRKLSKPPSS